MSRHRTPCGFCTNGNHDRCPGTIANATTPNATGDRTWTCPCAEHDHGAATAPEDAAA